MRIWRSMRLRWVTGLFAIGASILGLTLSSVITAAQSPGWTSPVNISQSKGLSSWPAIIADQYGLVHLFWAQNSGSPYDTGNTIFYSRWDGQAWSEPNDISAYSPTAIVSFPAVALDNTGWLHLIWRNDYNIFYSKAPAVSASSAQAWSSPVRLPGDFNPAPFYPYDIVADKNGYVYVAYSAPGSEMGVYAVRSTDHGETWSDPVLVELMPRIPPGDIRLASDGRGRIHLVWAEALQSGYSGAVYYSRSEDQGETWIPAITIARRDPGDYKADWITVAAFGDNEIHLVWMDGPAAYSYHQWSLDGGQTWTAPREILTDLVGESGYTVFLTDSLNRLHLFGVKRTRVGGIHGLYHSVWAGDDWSPAQRVEEASLSLAATIANGNEVFAVSWYEDLGDLFLVRGVLDAPPIAPEAPPTATPSAVAKRAGLAATSVPTAIPTAPARPLEVTPGPSQSSERQSDAFALVIGVLPALFLVATVVVLGATRKRYR